jgi:CMP/dCMP kinase
MGDERRNEVRYKALTISREYGSGGAEIAGLIAKKLGWELVDKYLISEISKKAKVTVNDAAVMDETIDPWLHRITRTLWGKGADGFSAFTPVEIFDANEAAVLAKNVINEAYRIGHCVIVGRGSQCILHGKEDVFHAFVYAQWKDRAHRIRMRQPHVANVPELLHSVEGQRAGYIRLHYGANQLDPHLYNLMIDSMGRIEKTAQLILSAMDIDQRKLSLTTEMMN